MRASDSLKAYIGFFQYQLVKIHNCSEDVSLFAFISRLQVTHPLYKHLLQYNVTRWSNTISRAQKYLNLEEVMKGTISQPPRKVAKKKNRNHTKEAQPPGTRVGDKAPTRSAHSRTLRESLQTFQVGEHFTPLKLPI